SICIFDNTPSGKICCDVRNSQINVDCAHYEMRPRRSKSFGKGLDIVMGYPKYHGWFGDDR
ncbi:MAG: hypothetical protein KDK27_07610, partial [Leptospiraceae bacterium]|nr:hypothetical protein [Leptospiraceae bacterium]